MPKLSKNRYTEEDLSRFTSEEWEQFRNAPQNTPPEGLGSPRIDDTPEGDTLTRALEELVTMKSQEPLGMPMATPPPSATSMGPAGPSKQLPMGSQPQMMGLGGAFARLLGMAPEAGRQLYGALKERITGHREDINKIIHRESRGDPGAVSPKGAVGLGQLMESNYPTLTREELMEPRSNIDLAGSYYIHLLDKYKGDRKKALAAYNMGPTKFNAFLKQYGGNWETPLQVKYPKVARYIRDQMRGEKVSIPDYLKRYGR